MVGPFGESPVRMRAELEEIAEEGQTGRSRRDVLARFPARKKEEEEEEGCSDEEDKDVPHQYCHFLSYV